MVPQSAQNEMDSNPGLLQHCHWPTPPANAWPTERSSLMFVKEPIPITIFLLLISSLPEDVPYKFTYQLQESFAYEVGYFKGYFSEVYDFVKTISGLLKQFKPESRYYYIRRSKYNTSIEIIKIVAVNSLTLYKYDFNYSNRYN